MNGRQTKQQQQQEQEQQQQQHHISCLLPKFAQSVATN